MNEEIKLSKYERWKPIIDRYIKEFNDIYGEGVFDQDTENVIIKTSNKKIFILKQWFEDGEYPLDKEKSINIRDYIDDLMKEAGIEKKELVEDAV